MKVTITNRGLALVQEAVRIVNAPDAELILGWLDDHTTRRTAIRYLDITGPAIMWARLRDVVADRLYGRHAGGGRSGETQPARRALKQIAQQVALREGHPAMNHRAALGDQRHELIPAWRVGDGYSPYPADGDFVILVPSVVNERVVRGVVTTWEPQHPSLWRSTSPELQLLDLEVHLRFVEQLSSDVFSDVVSGDKRRR